MLLKPLRVSVLVQEFGSDYAMRIWLDPAKMQNLGVTISEVTAAIKGQNLQAAAGTVWSKSY